MRKLIARLRHKLFDCQTCQSEQQADAVERTLRGEKTRTYGGTGTIHRTKYLDIEVDTNGNVVAVWFRCQPLPFKQSDVDTQRSEEMRRMYETYDATLISVEVSNP
jgi:hypothetical protein